MSFSVELNGGILILMEHIGKCVSYFPHTECVSMCCQFNDKNNLQE